MARDTRRRAGSSASISAPPTACSRPSTRAPRRAAIDVAADSAGRRAEAGRGARAAAVVPLPRRCRRGRRARSAVGERTRPRGRRARARARRRGAGAPRRVGEVVALLIPPSIARAPILPWGAEDGRAQASRRSRRPRRTSRTCATRGTTRTRARTRPARGAGRLPHGAGVVRRRRARAHRAAPATRRRARRRDAARGAAGRAATRGSTARGDAWRRRSSAPATSCSSATSAAARPTLA